MSTPSHCVVWSVNRPGGRLKVDYRSVSAFVHAETLTHKKTLIGDIGPKRRGASTGSCRKAAMKVMVFQRRGLSR